MSERDLKCIGNINNVDKSNQWFGATVASGGADGQILACAPRLVWVETAFESMRQEREPTGTCFVGESDFTNFVNFSPCQSTNREDYGFDKITHCQAGFSGKILSDNSALVMGAPGSYYLQGQIYVQSLLNQSVVQATQESNTGTYSFDNSYRGYSLALGDFNGDGVQDYVVGTPRAESLMGLVAIFDQNLNQFNQVVGTQIVAYFGYSVTVVDVNNDTYDDLLVGAPMYMDDAPAIQRWEAGCVYVYLQNPDVGPRLSPPDGEVQMIAVHLIKMSDEIEAEWVSTLLVTRAHCLELEIFKGTTRNQSATNLLVNVVSNHGPMVPRSNQ
nr:integrin alpha-V-like [Lytechinus pictus]